MNITVKNVTLDWKSDDGQKVKSLIVTEDGQLFRTWSKTIAVVGWTGEVESYEDPRNAGQMLIKQPQKSGFGGSKFDSDGMAWGNALTNAVALVTRFSTEKTTSAAMMETIKTTKYLFDNRPSGSLGTTGKEVAAIKETKPSATSSFDASEDLPPVDQIEESF